MTNKDIPSWLKTSEDYIPKKDKDSFVAKNILSVMTVLSKIKKGQGGYNLYSAFPLFKLIYTFVYILLTSLSKNSAFLLAMVAVVVVRIAFLKSEQIIQVLKAVFSAELFSFLILIPSLFLGNKYTIFTITIKLFITISLVSILSVTTKWNYLTSSLQKLHIPQVIIFTLDTTIKYIISLGEISLGVLDALKVRSIGKNTKKASSISGVVGITFLKSKDMAEEMENAMECRGFSGDYKILCKKKWRKIDFLYLFFMLVVVVLFIYLEIIV